VNRRKRGGREEKEKEQRFSEKRKRNTKHFDSMARAV
tara:strand:+ start:533 stop:643 length:111 start_codon:yes stop_codon:yes gene_type:complete